MNSKFDFDDLFIFEMANNHQGDVQHGIRIVQEMGKIAQENGIKAAVKLQFRELETFIHPAHRERSDNKHIPRFVSTRLSAKDFGFIVDEIRKAGMLTMCTPFDEPSVDRIVEMGIEILKIGSCSANDWPLLEAVVKAGKPVIWSTGGLTMKEIDDVVSFFDHRRVHHAIQHCVSIYPTPDNEANLNMIDVLRSRYPGKVVGYSTHEAPDNLGAVYVAVAKGARMLERHVGLQTERYKLNAYSSTPEQIERWVKAAKQARVQCGASERLPATSAERESLNSLKRGVFARRSLKAGLEIQREDVYFAMPIAPGGLNSGQWRPGVVATAPIDKDAPVTDANAKLPEEHEKQVLFTAIHTIKGMLNEARIALSADFQSEFSHHYGIRRFQEFGATLIDCINRSYCKKLIIQMPGQKHPCHYHKRKEETFQILWGVLEVIIDSRPRTLYPGDTLLIQQGVWHEFWTKDGAIFEEVSTTHHNDDSYYEDEAINALPRPARKTVVNHWGRYQL
jgi:sialic acid synthase SpsE/mannose-6-phosphate isomerase-like protein (cupin superfamily)